MPITPSTLTIRHVLVLALATTLPAAAATAADETLPLGHADFQPTSEHPVGWWGDGSGRFSGASGIPTQWDEASGRNIAWRTPMPGRTCAAPIVVGDRVFTMADPDELVCVDAATGAIRWRGWAFPAIEAMPEATHQRYRDAYRGFLESYAHMYEGIFASAWKPGDDYQQHLAPGGVAKQPYLINIDKKDDHAWDWSRNPAVTAWLEAITEPHPAVTSWNDWKKVTTTFDATLAEVPGLGKPGRINKPSDGSWYGMTFATPCSDGQRVYARFGTGAVAAFDLEGRRLWSYVIGGHPKRIKFKYLMTCPHPYCYRDRIYVPHGGDFIVLDAASGREVQRIEGVRADNGWSICREDVPVRIDGVQYLLTGIRALIRAADGAVITAQGPNLSNKFCATPVAGDLVYGPAIPVPGGEGRNYRSQGKHGVYRLLIGTDGARYEQLWEVDRPLLEHCPLRVPVVHDGKVFALGADGSFAVYRLADGEPLWPTGQQTVPFAHPEPAGWLYAHPVWADGKVLLTNRTGEMVVFDADRLAITARNVLDPSLSANCFIQGDRIYHRGLNYLYCIAPGARLPDPQQ